MVDIKTRFKNLMMPAWNNKNVALHSNPAYVSPKNDQENRIYVPKQVSVKEQPPVGKIALPTGDKASSHSNPLFVSPITERTNDTYVAKELSVQAPSPASSMAPA